MRLSGKSGIILGLLLSLAVIAALWFGYTKPQVANHAEAVSERDESIEKTDYYKEKIEEINTTGVDYLGNLFRDVQIADQLLPGVIDPGDIALTYPSLATREGLDVISFDPVTTPSEGYSSFTTQFEGSYQEITSWLETLENSENLITIGSMEISSASDSDESSGEFTLSMELRFHSFPEPDLKSRSSNPQGEAAATEAPAPAPAG